MKILKHLLALSLLFITFIGNAQDVGLPWMVYPIKNQRVHLQYTYDIEVVVKNYGPTSVPKNAGMNFILLYDGITQGTFSLNAHPKINSGDSLNVTINNQSFSTPNATLEVTVVLDYLGDISKNNDTVSNILRFSVDNNVDLGPSSIDIIVPDVDSVIAPGSTISLMKATISNYGTVTLPREYIVKIESKIYGQTKGPFTGVTATALDTGGSFLITVSGQQPKVQSNNGPFQVCVTIINNSDDKNNSNDDYCQLFYAYDWTGIPKNDEGTISSYVSNGNLQIDQLSTKPVKIQIYNIKGQLVVDKNIQPNNLKGVLNISHLNDGIYILKVIRENQVIHSNKFTIH